VKNPPGGILHWLKNRRAASQPREADSRVHDSSSYVIVYATAGQSQSRVVCIRGRVRPISDGLSAGDAVGCQYAGDDNRSASRSRVSSAKNT
jgi:hypothetical protein